MKLGVLTVLYQQLTLDDALDKLANLSIEAVELGTGNYPGNHHCNPDELLGDRSKILELQKNIEGRGLIISALSQHGNPLHPDEAVAAGAHDTWRKTVELANAMGVSVVNAFSGCPGDHDHARYPNWVTCAWPDDFGAVLKWQWEEKVIPYWTKEAAFARERGVRIAFEMHPGFVVYNPESLLRLRAAVGSEIGANYDPSHLFWQGIDPVSSIKEIGRENAIFHVHAKDTFIDPINTRVNGVLDTKTYDRLADRSWLFRTVGYGHGEKVWRNIMTALRTVGYDYVISIEHEDALLSIDEGLRKAVEFLDRVVVKEPPGNMWWA
jgi:sugar phosphate isomerase/epimerase